MLSRASILSLIALATEPVVFSSPLRVLIASSLALALVSTAEILVAIVPVSLPSATTL